MSILNDFESGKGGPVWEPKFKGKGDNAVAFEVNDKSYLVGWYLGTKYDVGPNNSKLHEFKMKQVGNNEHLQGGDIPESGKIGVWGSGVLDKEIVDRGIQIGQCVAIQYKGKKKPQNGGKPYHTWTILIPTDMSKYPSLSMSDLSGVASPLPESAMPQNEEAPKAVPANEAMNDDDDDLPF